MLGAECLRESIGLPFARIEYRQGGPCIDLELPAAIAITRLDEGVYSLDLSEFETVEVDPDSAECIQMSGSLIDDVCYVPAEQTTRLLSVAEVQRVDEVLALLEEETLIDLSRVGVPCDSDPCGYVFGRVNQRTYQSGSCPGAVSRQLTAESSEALRNLWLSFLE